MTKRLPILSLFAAALLAAGCNGNEAACEDALRAQEECATRAGVDFEVDEEAECDGDDFSEAYWDCVEDAFDDDDDCENEEEYNRALDAFTDCLRENDDAS